MSKREKREPQNRPTQQQCAICACELPEDPVVLSSKVHGRRVCARCFGADIERSVSAPPPDHYWLGWVLRLHPDGGVERVRVRLPSEAVAVAIAAGEAETYPPTLRSNVAAQLARDVMRDETINELTRARDGRG